MNIAKLEKKFGLNDILPYIEISKPKLRNKLNQLFAMKNSILILCLLFAGVTFGQDFKKSQTLKSFSSCTDSIVVYKMSDTVYTNVFRFVRAHKFRKHESIEGGTVVGTSNDSTHEQVFTSEGVYAIVCFNNGTPMKPSFLHVDERYVLSGHKDVRVGHREYYYYYIQ